MKRFNFLLVAIALVLTVTAVSCSTMAGTQDDYYGQETHVYGNRVYVDDPYRGTIVLERDPRTGRYYEVGNYDTYSNGYYGNRYSRGNRNYGNSYPSYRRNSSGYNNNNGSYNNRNSSNSNQNNDRSSEEYRKNRDEARSKILGGTH